MLSRLTVKDINNMHSNLGCLESLPRINADPLSSNVYSIGERVLLTWLNFHYESMRKSVWACCTKGNCRVCVLAFGMEIIIIRGKIR